MAEAFPISGNIDPASFPYLLVNLHQQGATGSLKVEGPSHQKALYFRGGRILFGSSNDPRDQLGAILIDAGRLDTAQFQEVSARVGPGNPLAKVLSDSGLVNQRDLGDAAKVKVERILADVLGYTSGTFEFEDDVLPKGAIDLKLSAERLFAAAVQRVEDPAFSNRHLGGPQALLRLNGRDGGRLSELDADLGRLPGFLDGQRTLAESAHLAGMEQQTAARLACTLLFLGWAERAEQVMPTFDEADDATALDFSQSTSTGPIPASEEDEPFFLPDFAAQAAPAPAAAPIQQEEDEEDLPVFSLPTEDAGSAPTLRFNVDALPIGDVAAPTLRMPVVPTAPPAPAAAPVAVAAPPAASEPATVAPKLPVARQREDLPLVQPPARRAAPRPTKPAASVDEPELTTRPGAPGPSKSDLEALDTLLNSRGLEAPLKGAIGSGGGDSGPQPVRRPTWEPSFGRASTSNRPPRGGTQPNRLPLVIGAVTLLIAAVLAAGWWFLRRPQARPVAQATTPTRVSPPDPGPLSTPASVDSTATATPAPVAQPSPQLAASPATTPPSPAPTQGPSLPTPAPVRTGGDVREARALLQRGDLSAASQAFAAHVAAAPRGSYSIQLLVACAPETISKALASVASEELYLLPVRYQKRACYRLCWGLYDSRARAESARRGVPAYFTSGGAAPKVLSTPELRP